MAVRAHRACQEHTSRSRGVVNVKGAKVENIRMQQALQLTQRVWLVRPTPTLRPRAHQYLLVPVTAVHQGLTEVLALCVKLEPIK